MRIFVCPQVTLLLSGGCGKIEVRWLVDAWSGVVSGGVSCKLEVT